MASAKQMRDLLKVATVLSLPCVILVGDEKQLDGLEADAPCAQLEGAGMRTATKEEIVRQRPDRGRCGPSASEAKWGNWSRAA